MLSRREKFKSFMKSKYMRHTFLEYTNTEVRTQCKSISSAYEIVDKKWHTSECHHEKAKASRMSVFDFKDLISH